MFISNFLYRGPCYNYSYVTTWEKLESGNSGKVPPDIISTSIQTKACYLCWHAVVCVKQWRPQRSLSTAENRIHIFCSTYAVHTLNFAVTAALEHQIQRFWLVPSTTLSLKHVGHGFLSDDFKTLQKHQLYHDFAEPYLAEMSRINNKQSLQVTHRILLKMLLLNLEDINWSSYDQNVFKPRRKYFYSVKMPLKTTRRHPKKYPQFIIE